MHVWVVITRTEKFWLQYVPQLQDYPKIVRLRCNQKVTLSEKNLKDYACQK